VVLLAGTGELNMAIRLFSRYMSYVTNTVARDNLLLRDSFMREIHE